MPLNRTNLDEMYLVCRETDIALTRSAGGACGDRMGNTVRRRAGWPEPELDLYPALFLQLLHAMLLIREYGRRELHGVRHADMRQRDDECSSSFFRGLKWHMMPPSSPAYDKSETV